MMLLIEACKTEDAFFLVLHQLLSLWCITPQDAYKHIPLDLPTTSRAFSFLESLLKNNQGIAPAHQQWFARFPVADRRFRRFAEASIGDPALLTQIVTFLASLVKEFSALLTASSRRNYPFLVDELLSSLNCYSPVLQYILFTACRKHLGVPDGSFATQLEQSFREDQQRHWSPVTGVHVLAPVTPPGDIERRNAPLINHYTFLVNAASSRPTIWPTPASVPSLSPAMSSCIQPTGYADHFATRSSVQHHQTTPATGAAYAAQLPTSSTGVQASRQQRQPLPNPPQYHQIVAHTTPKPQLLAIPEGRALHQQAVACQHAQRRQHDCSHHQQLAQQQHLAQQQQRQQQERRLTQAQQQNSRAIPPLASQPAIHVATQSPHRVRLGQSSQPQQAQYNLWAQHLHSPAASPSPTVNSGLRQSLGTAPQLSAQQLQSEPAQQRHGSLKAADPLLPPKGTLLMRPDWPYDATDPKSILMSLNQAYVRSSKRVHKNGETERYYQAVKSLPVEPTPVAPRKTMYKFRFEVSDAQFALAATHQKQPDALLPVVEHLNGALRWRVRCCAVPNSLEMPIAQHEWVTLDVNWPSCIHMTLNHKVLDIRRQPHNGKGLPTEVTDFIVQGTNVLMIAVYESPADSALRRYLAIELVETLSHSTVVNAIWSYGTIPEEQTLGTIKKRLSASADDDIAFEATDLSIDLTDPFSSTIFSVPVRGTACTHMECFDLGNWLTTRPAKPPARCPHKYARCTCPTSAGPWNPDNWRCPICSKDARPYSLRVDGFLQGVRAKLKAEGKIGTKCLRVRADGSWSVVLDAEDEGSEDGAGGGGTAAKAEAAGGGMPAAPVVRREVEIIEID